jgi:hypothetical protein
MPLFVACSVWKILQIGTQLVDGSDILARIYSFSVIAAWTIRMCVRACVCVYELELTFLSGVFLEKLIVAWLVKLPDFYGIRTFSIVLTGSRQWVQHEVVSLVFILAPRFPKIHFNIVFPSTSICLTWSLDFRFSGQDFMCISSLHECLTPCPYQPCSL